MFINNCKIEIWEPEINNDPYNKYYTGKPNTYHLQQTIPASFQNTTSTTDKEEDYGTTYDTTYKIYIQLTTNISPHSIIRKQGDTTEYTIKGLIQNYNHIIPHTKINVEYKKTKDL